MFNPTEISENDELEKLHGLLAKEVLNNQTKISEFIVLINGQELFKTMTLYYESINNLNEMRTEWMENKKNYEDIFESYNLIVNDLLKDNFKILNKLKSYILYD